MQSGGYCKLFNYKIPPGVCKTRDLLWDCMLNGCHVPIRSLYYVNGFIELSFQKLLCCFLLQEFQFGGADTFNLYSSVV